MQNSLLYREILNKILDDLPEEKIAELVDFAVFIKEMPKMGFTYSYIPVVKAVPAESLQTLCGTVAWGGNALDDTERLYE